MAFRGPTLLANHISSASFYCLYQIEAPLSSSPVQPLHACHTVRRSNWLESFSFSPPRGNNPNAMAKPPEKLSKLSLFSAIAAQTLHHSIDDKFQGVRPLTCLFATVVAVKARHTPIGGRRPPASRQWRSNKDQSLRVSVARSQIGLRTIRYPAEE